MKTISNNSLLAVVMLFSATFSVCAAYAAELQVRRFTQNPIIRPEMLPGSDGGNINGPSLIRVPAWITNRLGNYYLYFAHHSGKYIRLAYADQLEGPWKIHEPGTLRLEEAPGCKGHIASPDVHVDEQRREIRMYFHGPAKAVPGQRTFVAVSPDGLRFKAADGILGIFLLAGFPLGRLVVRHGQGWTSLPFAGWPERFCGRAESIPRQRTAR